MNPIDRSFYLNPDVVFLARSLIGKWLFTKVDGSLTGGIITETEAYKGPEDKACHAYNNRRTKRTEVMFGEGGHAYIYLCYGMHTLFNVVTGPRDCPHAVLIRAIEPQVGIEKMKERRGKKELGIGPGVLTQSLSIQLIHNGCDLNSGPIWIEERDRDSFKIEVSKRIGVDYAGDDAHLLWRFKLVR